MCVLALYTDNKEEYMDYIFKSKPYAHQEKAFVLSREKAEYALLMEQGTGKSKVIVDTGVYLYGLGRINSILLIAPNGVHSKWKIEDFPFSIPDYVDYTCVVWHAGDKKSMEQCETLFNTGNTLRILCMNVETFSHQKGVALAKRFLQATEALMVVDESSRIKTPGASRTKNIIKLGKYAKYKRILSGTPVVNSPLDLYSQFTFLNEDIFGQSFYAFKNEYAEMIDPNSRLAMAIRSKTGSTRVPQVIAKDANGHAQYKNLDKLRDTVADYSFRVTKEECLDLPSKIYERRFFDLPKQHMEMYTQLATKARLEFNEETLTVLHKMTLVLRLQQLTSGYFPNDDGITVSMYPNPKENPRIACLLDTLEDIEGSVIIWARFRHEIETLHKVLGDQSVTYYGGDSKDQRKSALDQFMLKQKKYLIGNAQSGGIGLNLTVATTVIYYSNDFSLENRLQSEDRAHRIGQNEHVLYIDIEAENTVDRGITESLRNKKNVADYMVDHKEYI
jgi:SNF2 family DNA or RNA helicase